MRKRLLSMLLCLCIVLGLLPTVVFAAGTDKAIMLVDSGTAANIGGGQADNIYFGTYQQSSDGNGGYNTDPIKWRVLENGAYVARIEHFGRKQLNSVVAKIEQCRRQNCTLTE